jgi:hypothetical protein
MAEERIIYGRLDERGARIELRLPILDPIASLEVEITSDRDPIFHLRQLCLPNDWIVFDVETSREISVNGDACREWHELSGALELMLGTCRVKVNPTLKEVCAVMGRDEFELRSVQNSDRNLFVFLAIPLDDSERGWIIQHDRFVLCSDDVADDMVERMVCGCPHKVLRRTIVPYEKALDIIRYFLQQQERSPEFTWMPSEGTIA